MVLPDELVGLLMLPYRLRMKRLTTAPNLALATLWADMLTHAGINASVQRAYASSIAGEIPPDQALPEIWIQDEAQFGRSEASSPAGPSMTS